MELDSTGIDYEKAIERFAGNEGMFFKFLFRFPTEPTYQAILTEYEENNSEPLYEQLHTLKGVAGNLGIMSIYELCKKSMEAVHAEDKAEIDASIEQIKEEYAKICKEILLFQNTYSA